MSSALLITSSKVHRDGCGGSVTGDYIKREGSWQKKQGSPDRESRIEELLDAIYYLTRQIARLEDQRRKIAATALRPDPVA